MTTTTAYTPTVPAEFLVEHRNAPRVLYTEEHQVAPWSEEHGPSAFLTARCRDISASGICFYYPVKPDTKYLVADFGTESTELLWLIEVVWVSPEMLDGEQVYRVGGKFDRRLINRLRNT